MTLATHAVAGSLIGAIAYQNPVAAGLFGFASHFLLDAIPHWDYHLESARVDRTNPLNNDITPRGTEFVFDLIKIAFDFGLGLAIVYMIYGSSGAAVLTGALVGGVAATMPDPLQFVYMRWRHEPMITIQKFHLFMHAKTKLDQKLAVGVGSQLVIVALVAVLGRTLF